MTPSPLRILIVEDDNHFRQNLAKLIEEQVPGSSVQQAMNVEQGKACLTAGIPFDIVILDFRLPVAGGGQEIDTSLCELSRIRHPNSLVIHLTMNKAHPEAERHMREVHPAWKETVGQQNMETQHMGILISKGFPEGGNVKDLKQAERLWDEILTAINRRVKLKAIETGLSDLLGEVFSRAPSWSRGVGRVAVPDAGLTSHLASLRLALECAWPWLPEGTKSRARRVFSIHEDAGEQGRVRVQMI